MRGCTERLNRSWVTTSLTPALSPRRGRIVRRVFGMSCARIGRKSPANQELRKGDSFSPGEKVGMRASVETKSQRDFIIQPSVGRPRRPTLGGRTERNTTRNGFEAIGCKVSRLSDKIVDRLNLRRPSFIKWNRQRFQSRLQNWPNFVRNRFGHRSYPNL